MNKKRGGVITLNTILFSLLIAGKSDDVHSNSFVTLDLI